jgi:hypothetical protein
LDSLDNAQLTANTPLGIPWNRFGFYSRFGINRPVEYLFNPAAAGPVYIGRFTHEETSHLAFDWPGVEQGPGTGANVMIRDDLVLSPIGVVSVDANTSGIYDAGDASLLGGRAGEDILLTNVEGLDIEVWDSGFIENPNANGTPGFQPFDPQDDPNGNGVQDSGSWVDVGHPYPFGHYREVARANVAYGPGGGALPAMNHVFDTWHPSMGERPPFRPLQFSPTVPPTTPETHYVWQAGFAGYDNVGEVFFPNALGADGQPGVAGVDDDSDGNTDIDSGNPDVDEFEAPGSDDNLSLGLVVSQPGTSGAVTPPSQAPGTYFDDGTVRWRYFDNRIGLEQIRITVRYRDVSTQQARQVTLVHSLVNSD